MLRDDPVVVSFVEERPAAGQNVVRTTTQARTCFGGGLGLVTKVRLRVNPLTLSNRN